MSIAEQRQSPEGCRPQPDMVKVEGGYRPQVVGPVDISKLKLPRGGSAIEPPRSSAQQQSDRS
jgi:hypothetical protein